MSTSEKETIPKGGAILGVNVRAYPNQIQDRLAWMTLNIGVEMAPGWISETEIKTVAVLVAGEIGDYAVYIGHGSPEFVARSGNKLSFKEARCHFPGIQKELYREE